MRWVSGLFLAMGLSLAAGAAMAGCPDHDHHGRHHIGVAEYDRDYAEWRRDYDAWARRYGDSGEVENSLFDGRAYDRPEQREEVSPEAWRDGGRDDGRFDESLDDRDAGGEGASTWYRDGRVPRPLCDCDGIRLSEGFFYDTGGVGPIPADGYGGGGGYFVMGGGSGFSGSSARAFAGASASSSASVSVRFGGGFRGGGHRGGGYKGGHGSKH